MVKIKKILDSSTLLLIATVVGIIVSFVAQLFIFDSKDIY